MMQPSLRFTHKPPTRAAPPRPADAQPNQGALTVDEFRRRLESNAQQKIFTTTIGAAEGAIPH